MAPARRHPSMCGCPPPEVNGAGLVLVVTTCPVCLEWERAQQLAQLELELELRVGALYEGGDPERSDRSTSSKKSESVDSDLPF